MNNKETFAKKVLISPLDWGIGHATRCVPIIEKLISNNFEVTIAGSGRSFIYLQKYFPNLKSVYLEGFSPVYTKNGSVFYKLLQQMPKMLLENRRERKLLEKYLAKEKYDLIISDNRYGFYNKNIPSIIITHQLKVFLPGLLKYVEKPLQSIIRNMLRNFDQIWIPDYKNEPNLSGDLAHDNYTLRKANYIGHLSRFENSDLQNNTQEDFENYQIVVMISGSEPKRTILEKKILNQLKDLNYKTIVFTGKPEEDIKFNFTDKISVYSNPSKKLMHNALKNAQLVICRSGYSSLMDLMVFNSKALLIPTDGQPEQIFLAQELEKTKQSYYIFLDNMNLEKDIGKALNYKGIGEGFNNNFKDEILNLICKLTDN